MTDKDVFLSAKQKLRKEILSDVRRRDAGDVVGKSVVIQELLTGLPEFAHARMACCYVAMSGEVGTGFIIERCWSAGKKLCAPAFRDATGRYEPALFAKDMEVVLRHGKTPEPASGDWVDEETIDFMVVPGLAFDGNGGRLGRGGGYYDRMMAGHARMFKVAVAFDWQVVPEVPMGAQDARVDVIVTEKRVILIKGAKSAF